MKEETKNTIKDRGLIAIYITIVLVLVWALLSVFMANSWFFGVDGLDVIKPKCDSPCSKCIFVDKYGDELYKPNLASAWGADSKCMD